MVSGNVPPPQIQQLMLLTKLSAHEGCCIREVETERQLMDCHGLFLNEISYHHIPEYHGHTSNIDNNLRVSGRDFCSWGECSSWRNQATHMGFNLITDRNPLAGSHKQIYGSEKQMILWSSGKPTGNGWAHGTNWGKGREVIRLLSYVWGFDQKVLHLKHDENEENDF